MSGLSRSKSLDHKSKANSGCLSFYLKSTASKWKAHVDQSYDKLLACRDAGRTKIAFHVTRMQQAGSLPDSP